MDEGRLERYQWFYRSEFPTVCRTLFLVHRDRRVATRSAEEAFVRAYRRWSRLVHYDRPELWIRRVAIKRAARATRRGLFGRRRASVDAPVEDKPAQQQALWAALGELSRVQRAAVVLFYFEDRPVSDMAEVMSSSEAAVKGHLQRGLRRLGKLLDEQVGDVAR